MEPNAAALRLATQTASLVSVKPPSLGVLAEGVPGAPLFSPFPLPAASSLGAITPEVFSALARYFRESVK